MKVYIKNSLIFKNYSKLIDMENIPSNKIQYLVIKFLLFSFS